jgi:CheY-like chemotaxis protein
MTLTILIVEDHTMVLSVVRETLALEGWRVDACGDGYAALRMLESSRHYDLLMLDNDLPGVSGLELIQHARQLSHRRQTPIIMLSAGLHQAEAHRAGADAFLRKPEDISAIVESVTHLLAASS